MENNTNSNSTTNNTSSNSIQAKEITITVPAWYTKDMVYWDILESLTNSGSSNLFLNERLLMEKLHMQECSKTANNVN